MLPSIAALSMIDLGSANGAARYYDPDQNAVIGLVPGTLDQEPSVEGYHDDDDDVEVMVGDDGQEYAVVPLGSGLEVGRRQRGGVRRDRDGDGDRDGLVERVRNARQGSLQRRLDRSEEREERAETRQANRRGGATKQQEVNNSGLPDWLPTPDPGTTWERYAYDFAGTNSGASAAEVSVTRSIASRFVIEKISTSGTTAASLLKSLKYGDDFLVNHDTGSAVENFQATGFLVDSLKGKLLAGAQSATLLMAAVPASGLVRLTLFGYRMRPITC